MVIAVLIELSSKPRVNQAEHVVVRKVRAGRGLPDCLF
jgi:hypothetical protein